MHNKYKKQTLYSLPNYLDNYLPNVAFQCCDFTEKKKGKMNSENSIWLKSSLEPRKKTVGITGQKVKATVNICTGALYT